MRFLPSTLSIGLLILITTGCITSNNDHNTNTDISLDSAMMLLNQHLAPGNTIDTMDYVLGGPVLILYGNGSNTDTMELTNLAIENDTLSLDFLKTININNQDTLVTANGYYVIFSGTGTKVEGTVWKGVKIMAGGVTANIDNPLNPMLMFYYATTKKGFLANQPE